MIEIYFENLDKFTQEQLLLAYGISDPEEMNWDVFPVTVVEEPDLTTINETD